MSLVEDFYKNLNANTIPDGHTLCPDCETAIPTDLFVTHRERQHPPSPKTIAIPGAASQERFGYQED